jgi:archaeosortase B (VPXXXP-CTERM-specific)
MKKIKGPGRTDDSVGAKSKSYKPIIRFCLLFLGLLIVLTFAFPSFTEKFDPQFTWFMAATADITGFCLKLLGFSAQSSGRIVSLPNFSVEIVGECTGLYEMLIFLAAVIAYPSSWRKKLIGVGLGIPILYGINIVRMVFITLVGNWSPQSFDFMHMYFWQVAMILIILSVWILWIEKVVHYERKTVDIHT